MSVLLEAAVPRIPEWEEWLDNGEKYYKAASPKDGKSRFTPDLQYNLLSMSLEGYVMAISGYHNLLPENHTYTDLMDALERVVQVDPDLKEQVLRHESIQEICSIEDYSRSHPSETALGELRAAIFKLGELAHKICVQD